MNRISYACRIQKRHANSILSRYSKKELTPETTKSEFVMVGQVKVSRDEWNKMNNLEKSRLFLDNQERTEITNADLEGLTPAEIEVLKLELAEYLEHKELEKLETTRMREDMAEIQPMAKGRLDHTWIGYYQRQILQRMEAFQESKKRNPLKQGTNV